jgi:D-glycero-D-manno-heptose 1,7-bisphosphate phosphatase
VCDCRKPRPGLLLQAAREHPEIDLSRSTMIGNQMSDVVAGQAVGTTTILLDPTLSTTPGIATHVAPDLSAAVRWLLEERAES